MTDTLSRISSDPLRAAIVSTAIHLLKVRWDIQECDPTESSSGFSHLLSQTCNEFEEFLFCLFERGGYFLAQEKASPPTIMGYRHHSVALRFLSSAEVEDIHLAFFRGSPMANDLLLERPRKEGEADDAAKSGGEDPSSA